MFIALLTGEWQLLNRLHPKRVTQTVAVTAGLSPAGSFGLLLWVYQASVLHFHLVWEFLYAVRGLVCTYLPGYFARARLYVPAAMGAILYGHPVNSWCSIVAFDLLVAVFRLSLSSICSAGLLLRPFLHVSECRHSALPHTLYVPRYPFAGSSFGILLSLRRLSLTVYTRDLRLCGPSLKTSRYYGFCSLFTAIFTPSFGFFFYFKLVRPPRIRAITFLSSICHIYMVSFGQYWTLL